METLEVAFFGIDEMPPLSVPRNTEKQVKKMFELTKNPDLPTLFD